MSILGSLFGTKGRSSRCKTIKIKRSGCTQQLCHTGKGVTGWTFMAGTRRCPNKGMSGLSGTRKRRKTTKRRRRSRR